MDSSERSAMTKLDGAAEANWDELLGRSTASDRFGYDANFCNGKTILVTGAGGSIGTALAMRIANQQPRLLVLLDSSEHSLYLLQAQLCATCKPPRHLSILGSVADSESICSILTRYEPDLVIHAAAYKHVPLLESNPFAAMQNNALGTYRLAQAALLAPPCQIVMVSTDKAVNPVSIMGASKRIAEIALQAGSNTNTRMNSLRLGNVLGSQGSVVPLFLEQVSQKVTVTVTNPDAERFFFTIQESVSLILEAAAKEVQGKILIPGFMKSVKISDLANFVIAQCGASSSDSSRIAFTELRPGEKLVEEFVAQNEKFGETISPRLIAIESDGVTQDELHNAMMKLERSILDRDLRSMFQAVQGLVPNYQPSVTVLASNDAIRTYVHV